MRKVNSKNYWPFPSIVLVFINFLFRFKRISSTLDAKYQGGVNWAQSLFGYHIYLNLKSYFVTKVPPNALWVWKKVCEISYWRTRLIQLQTYWASKKISLFCFCYQVTIYVALSPSSWPGWFCIIEIFHTYSSVEKINLIWFNLFQLKIILLQWKLPPILFCGKNQLDLI